MAAMTVEPAGALSLFLQSRPRARPTKRNQQSRPVVTCAAPGYPRPAVQRILEPEVMDDEGEAIAYADMDHTAVNHAFVDRLGALGAGGRMLDIGTGPADIPLLVIDRWSDAHVV